MPGRRSISLVEGDLESRNLARTIGREVRTTRRRRRMTQAQLGDRVGLSRSRISEIERGEGRTATLETWVRLGIVLGRPLGMSFARDLVPQPSDSGHLEAQELVLRHALASGRGRTFEMPTRASPTAPSVDVALRDDRERALVLAEIWNRVDDLGRGARTTDRKLVEAEAVAIAIGHGRPYRVVGCWLLVDTAANRALVSRFSEVLRVRFPGSSRAWVAAFTGGGPVPERPGLAWVDLRGDRLVPMRLPSTRRRPTT